MNDKPSSDFIRDIVKKDIEAGKNKGRVHTRFPPEPNGYLHIGHAKSVCLNFGVAQEFGGLCNLRFDDTNPTKEEVEYVESILKDIRWLGFDWGDRLYFASDYFEQLYDWAVGLIQKGKAYVCSLSADEIREYRGTLTVPGKESPYRDRPIEENLDLFKRMRAGEFKEGEHVLRAKIDMASPYPRAILFIMCDNGQRLRIMDNYIVMVQHHPYAVFINGFFIDVFLHGREIHFRALQCIVHFLGDIEKIGRSCLPESDP